MADLPDLPESTKRLLDLRLIGLLKGYKLSRDAAAQYARTDEKTRGIALSKPPGSNSRYLKGWLTTNFEAKFACGIYSSAEFAKARIQDLATEYLRLWSPSSGWDLFAGQLEALKAKVLSEIASIWKESDATEQWYEAVVAPAVNAAISQKLGEFEDRARNAEMALLAGVRLSAGKSEGPNPALAAPVIPVPKGSGQTRKKPGPKRDYATASTVAEIVKQIAPDGKWRSQLDEICEALDEKKIPMPKPWKTKHGFLSWCLAGIDTTARGRHMAIEAIKHHLELATETPNQTIP